MLKYLALMQQIIQWISSHDQCKAKWPRKVLLPIGALGSSQCRIKLVYRIRHTMIERQTHQKENCSLPMLAPHRVFKVWSWQLFQIF